jgi:CBS domain containing-hemolysin-like protein
MSLLLPALIILLLVGFNGLFVAAEFAILGVRNSRIEHLVQSGNRAATWVRRTIADRQAMDRYFATAQIGITVASLGLGMYGEPVVAGMIEGPLHDWFGLEGASIHTVSFVLSLSLITYLHVVLGEMIPKSLALQRSEWLALTIAWPMNVLEKLMALPIAILNGIGLKFLGLIGVPPPDPESFLHTDQELELIIAESFAHGLVQRRDQQLLENIFDFGARRVGQLITPRTKIEAIPVDIGEKELLRWIEASSHSRFPVYDGSLDKIVGMFHVKDLVRQQLNGEGFDLRGMLRPVSFVPQTLAASQLLSELLNRKSHMAIVLDEYGGTLGLVTLEDLFEEVVGDILDEFDLAEEPPIQMLGPGYLLAQGDTLLEALEAYVPLAKAELRVQTIGGLVMSELGSAPEVGQELRIGEATLRVETVEGRAIGKVSIRFTPPV